VGSLDAVSRVVHVLGCVNAAVEFEIVVEVTN
jgi:hypothetical protein